MKVINTEFKDVKILVFENREDVRGTMEISLDITQMVNQGLEFQCKEQRIYQMPQKGTFFGIHFQVGKHPQAKVIHLLTGRGMDYIVDLRKESPTYKKWISIEIKGGDNQHIYIPQGYGHAFLSLEDNTTQMFTVNEHFHKTEAMAIRFDDPQIRLSFPIDIAKMSDNDTNAPYLEELDFEG